MKKTYKKPIVVIEAFQLDAAIAGSCATGTPVGHYENSCGYGESREGLEYQYFGEYLCDVDLTIGGGDGNDTHCYHGPINTSGQVFVWS